MEALPDSGKVEIAITASKGLCSFISHIAINGSDGSPG